MSVQEVIREKGVDNFTYDKAKEHRLYKSALDLLSEDDHAQRCLLNYEAKYYRLKYGVGGFKD
ncbi:hypothetical protein G9A89_013068 [Geosiphon pyriformis]|nr:hypothetical protein G9A89_013068 [Geosiphon pyriformis]